MRTVRARRPADRRETIARAAGRAFSERGYHAVGMEDIAASVGITAGALYRHFASKYELFALCARQLADDLGAALEAVPAGAPLEDLLGAAARTAVENRSAGGLYRWEARYLSAEDRDALRTTFRGVVDRVAGAIIVARGPDPALEHDPALARLLSAAALGSLGSATAHRTTIGARRLEDLLVAAAGRTALAPIPPAASPGRAAAPPPSVEPARGRRAEILEAAVPLFHRDGYAEVSMGAIAAAVGLTPSGLYRHFAGKGEILQAACLRAADALRDQVEQRLAGVVDARESLPALAEAYVAYSFENTALTSVALAESGGLPVAAQRPLRAAQRAHLAVWEQHLAAVRPDLATVETRVLVHAGLGVVTEAGRALRWQDGPRERDLVTRLVLAALGA